MTEHQNKFNFDPIENMKAWKVALEKFPPIATKIIATNKVPYERKLKGYRYYATNGEVWWYLNADRVNEFRRRELAPDNTLDFLSMFYIPIFYE